MTVKDQIPSFPDLIVPNTVRDLVAHGSDDDRVIASRYHSRPEREHADELALNRIIEFLRSGLIRATGRKSDIRQGSSERWQVQRYKQHSKIREYIDKDFWSDAVFIKSIYLNTVRSKDREYTDIRLVLDDCRKHLAEDIAAHADADNANEPEAEETRLQLLLGALTKRLVTKGLKVRTTIDRGHPAEILLNHARRWGADCIVVGARGLGGVRRFLIGSVSQHVAAHAECSVEVVRAGY